MTGHVTHAWQCGVALAGASSLACVLYFDYSIGAGHLKMSDVLLLYSLNPSSYRESYTTGGHNRPSNAFPLHPEGWQIRE